MCRGGASSGGGGGPSLTSASVGTIREAASGLRDKYSYEERASGGRRYSQSLNVWERGDQVRIYVPSSAYGSAGHVVIKGTAAASAVDYKGLKLVAERNRPRETPTIDVLKGFVDDLQAEVRRLR